MNKLKELKREYFFTKSENIDCKKENHKEGHCLPCRLLHTCFKNQKIKRLLSQGYHFKSVEILSPIIFSHKERRKKEKEWSLFLKKDFTYKNLEDFKKQYIDIARWLGKENNNINRYPLLDVHTKSLYFHFIKKIDTSYKDEYPCLIILHFHFSKKNIDEQYDDLLEEEEEEEDKEKHIINRRKVRLGVSSETRKNIYKRDNYTCYYCEWQNGINGRMDKPLTIDHIIPETHGGSSKDDNLITCCWECNIKKNDKFLKEIVDKWIFEPENTLKVKQYLFKKE